MGADIQKQELAIPTLNELPVQYENIITTLEVLGDDNSVFNL